MTYLKHGDEMKKLFDLTRYDFKMSGYFVDAQLNVYSNKQSVDVARPLTMSCPKNTNRKYWSLTYKGNKYSVDVEAFNFNLLNCSAFNSWKKENEMKSDASTKGFMIGSAGDDCSISFSSFPVIHQTEAAARAESERLAKAYKDKVFVYVEIRGYVRASGVSWS